ncbi:N-acetylmuramoyl-L-alanine amidase [Clostridium sp.]|uniref:N-acetylmuramoyl-L-alanine amidase n=1 Tax=Clostridium sp. TaxID=1506 RepID=UPI002850D766|nr:N-acetylmuramoyl-L-alanine amidase [Clostridium sp.]MDR3595428.1 N-acetylmuramoyl-L-alanine amidase [Clostridium sp.]
MNIKRKFITFVLSFAMLLSLIPTLSVQAVTTDFKIISDTKVTAKQAGDWAKSKGATKTFISLADLYFKYAPDHGNVNPAIAYVQAAKETGYGNFGGVLDDSYHNPCGLKTASGGGDTDPNAHQRFDSWDEGVQAHLDHLALYAGADGYPRSDTYDQRQFVTIKGIAATVNSLSTKWAPSATYGEEINQLYENLMDFAGVDYPKDVNNNTNTNNTQSSNGVPNPGNPETKPSAPSVADVIPDSKPQVVNNQQEDKPSITSTIGWKNENGTWYYYKSDNTKAIGWIKPDSSWYYLKDDGRMATGWLSDNGKWYYFDNSGAMIKGWKLIDGAWYFLSDSGAMATGVQFDGLGLYYLNDSGTMVSYSGWKKINNNWYFFDKSGKIKTGWLKDSNNWYYLQGDGSMVTGLKKIDNNNYMLNADGTMGTGWIQLNNYWYYFNADGSMATGWILDNGNYYYLYDTGAMAKGWINVNGTWYDLGNDGTMTTGWVTSNGDSYYLDTTTGRLLTNTTIDGYNIGSDGKRQNASSTNSQDNSPSNSPISNPTNNNPSTGKKTIVIDPGHDYGSDYGAESTIDGVTYSETVLNMQVADKLKTELQNRGYNVIMTRNLGEQPSYGSLMASLTHRVNVANQSNADFYISIHHNSAGETAQGVLSLYSQEAQDDSFGGKLDSARIQKSKQMASLINNNIANKLNLNNRGGQEQNLFVCRNTNMPAVLVEVGFITNKEEAIRCSDPASQQKVAQAIAEVIAGNI